MLPAPEIDYMCTSPALDRPAFSLFCSIGIICYRTQGHFFLILYLPTRVSFIIPICYLFNTVFGNRFVFPYT
ncbi:hypothetical protein GLOIN_2v1664131 [Rhizophagus irregularis DAOM 181602=DAOM 197198]|uniref:Uncharacterized protein n=1 Tax=Rhizophagus irregularis (strain DAOM 181602 / DAOM 197198 / MUCL 43194) TaxID=747089 RepID=A0A2P4PJT5_RHIID|nr:hypothetical protein GLOIN_2v1664131 [Rhizophagus irregularis DAOM 181602=DAOM 197198]POG65646.1 hypothetical protein GLOIN_2v1664131 [Rhizophagus irregularis DAOM 181602=DAOM 197198]GET54925.1 hypothetical protein GLOIN_2v1664131 [Rhizophagus irregularis DAOM 181602=DAOM 197198]|eukprot:XP_025172512.1 hypothetical protein GLOIN_2v1664131 [Rhizophagus irregularis DAOM 181602=DAOM 197198]